jgi:signal transduction histidine kinase
MTGPLRVLHLEDDPLDAELVRAALSSSGLLCEVTLVSTPSRFERALGEGPDLVLSDYTIPGFTGLAALRLAKRLRPETPFLFVSGTIGEEAAVEGLLNGAEDCVLKENLNRLGPAMRRAVRAAEERREHRRAEEALAHTRRLLDALVENASALVYAKDRDRRYVLLNRRAAALLGSTPIELLGRRDEQLGSLSLEGLALRREAEDRVWASGMPLEQEEPDPRPRKGGRNETPPTYLTQRFLLMGTDGAPYALCAVATDVTQFRRLEAQLRHAQKMEAVGQLAGGVAHDFNNLLTAILGYAQLGLDGLPVAATAERSLREIRKAAERAASVTRQLLTFSRKHGHSPTVFELGARVAEMESLLRRFVGEDVDLRIEPGPEPTFVRADPGHLEQVVLNLALNARDAMPNGGALTIRTFRDAPGVQAVLEVKDTGCGMDEHVQSHLFEPFFTTKEKGKGTGLGLATVYGIVKQAGGTIAVDSEPGKGATFRIHLPAVEDVARPAAAGRPEARVGGTETILLVEDEEQVRGLAREMLTRAGYKVLEAHDGAHALGICETYPQVIHALVSDVVMPQLSGPSLAERTARMRPDMKVLFISGYAPELVGSTGERAKIPLLRKPFTAVELLQALRGLFEPGAPAGSPPAPSS